MAYQLWLAAVLRAAGLTVVEVSGWKTRGSSDYAPEGLIAHDTGSPSLNTTDAGEIGVMINGREGLAGPIAQIYLSRTGTWHVVTAGQSNHVRTGWGGPYEGLGNHRLLGIEAQHMTGEPWSEVQYRSYVRGVAAILKHTKWPTVAGHKEHQPGAKVDPGFNMDIFRRDVAAAMSGETMSVLVILKGQPEVWLSNGVTRRHVKDPAELTAVKAASGWLGLVDKTVHEVTDLGPYGVDIADLIPVPAPPATVVLSPEDRAAIVADLAAALNATEAAADRARADVLDGPEA